MPRRPASPRRCIASSPTRTQAAVIVSPAKPAAVKSQYELFTLTTWLLKVGPACVVLPAPCSNGPTFQHAHAAALPCAVAIGTWPSQLPLKPGHTPSACRPALAPPTPAREVALDARCLRGGMRGMAWHGSTPALGASVQRACLGSGSGGRQQHSAAAPTTMRRHVAGGDEGHDRWRAGHRDCLDRARLQADCVPGVACRHFQPDRRGRPGQRPGERGDSTVSDGRREHQHCGTDLVLGCRADELGPREDERVRLAVLALWSSLCLLAMHDCWI